MISRQKDQAFFLLLSPHYFWAKEKNYKGGALEMANTRPNSYPCETPGWASGLFAPQQEYHWPQTVSMIWFMVVKDGVLGFLPGLFMMKSLQAL